MAMGGAAASAGPTQCLQDLLIKKIQQVRLVVMQDVAFETLFHFPGILQKIFLLLDNQVKDPG